MTEAMAKTLLTLGQHIDQACGHSRPTVMPCLSEGTSGKMTYADSYWLEAYRTPALVSVFRVLCHDDEDAAMKCAMNAYCVHGLRLCNYFLHTTWVDPRDLHSKSSIIYQCGETMWRSIRQILRGEEKKKPEARVKELLLRLSAIAAETHGRHTALNSIHRTTFLHKFYTKRKQVIYRATSDSVTSRWMDGFSTLPVNPHVNYARCLAVHELIVRGMTELSAAQLLTVNSFIAQGESTIPDLLRDADHIHLATLGCKMGRARMRTKLYEVNEDGCTCHAKCIGPYMGHDLKNTVWAECMERHCGLQVCGLCRLASIVENTAAEKPRLTVISDNPAIQACSNDACTAFKLVRCVCTDVRITASAAVNVRYSHRFYTTNSEDGQNSRMYGVCFSGRRMCKKTFVITGNQQRHWYRCEKCASAPDRDYGAPSSLGLTDSEPSTCLARYFTAGKCVINDMRKLCRGCKLASACRHVDHGLISSLVDGMYLPAILRKIRLLVALRRWLETPAAWTCRKTDGGGEDGNDHESPCNVIG